MRGQRGQALTELALVAPLFAVLLLLCAFGARLALTRLALIQAGRDATLVIARNTVLWSQTAAQQQASVRRLLERRQGLDPQALTLSFESVAPLGLDRIAALGPVLNSPAGRLLDRLDGLRRYHYRYHLAMHGLLGRYGGDWTMEEAFVVHGDPWTMEGQDLMQRILQ
jgi:hypothetical protein